MRREQDAASQFPEAQRVVADYPDGAQAYVALNFAGMCCSRKSSSADGARPPTYDAYYNVSEGIRTQQLVAGDAAATAFDARVRDLKRDRTFREGVLAKYHLANVPVEGGTAPGQLRNTDVTDSMIKKAALEAVPIFLVTLMAMIFITQLMMQNSTNSPTADSRMLAADGLPALPEALRVVKVPGLEYTIGVLSGMVLDKETTMKTQFQTTTTQAGYQMGNGVMCSRGARRRRQRRRRRI